VAECDRSRARVTLFARWAGARLRAALQNANFEFPARKSTVNLAPADLPSEPGRFDLPIALGILAATGRVERPAI
jgi:magnesium chelatase family protein